MERRTKIVAGVAVAAALIAGGATIAVASGVADSETPITGEALQKASAAALAHTGEGRVTDTEVGDEEARYEVEVTLGNGDEVDVHLDENFAVVSTEGPDDSSDEDGADEDSDK